MHIIDIWLEEIKIFAPSNLKSLLIGIGYQLVTTFRYLFIDWWWFSLLILFSHIIMYGLLSIIIHPALILLLQGLLLAAKAFYAFLATLAAFPVFIGHDSSISHSFGSSGRGKSSSYYSTRQMFLWPIVTPFVLWIYFSWHIYKFLSFVVSPEIIITTSTIASHLLFLDVDWFASPFFVFFAFIILATHSMNGVVHSLEHAFGMVFYTYPVSAIMFGLLYLIGFGLNYFIIALALCNVWVALAINPIVILIPLAAVLFGAIYQWHMRLVDEY